jgi:hypothetical protein
VFALGVSDIGLWPRISSPSGLTCSAAIPLVSGVPKTVPSVGWYRFVALVDGVIDVDWVNDSGGGDISVYIGGSCASLPAPSLYEDAGNDQSGSWVVSAGDVIRVQIEGGPLTGTLTITRQVFSRQMNYIPQFSRQL